MGSQQELFVNVWSPGMPMPRRNSLANWHARWWFAEHWMRQKSCRVSWRRRSWKTMNKYVTPWDATATWEHSYTDIQQMCSLHCFVMSLKLDEKLLTDIFRRHEVAGRIAPSLCPSRTTRLQGGEIWISRWVFHMIGQLFLRGGCISGVQFVAFLWISGVPFLITIA